MSENEQQDDDAEDLPNREIDFSAPAPWRQRAREYDSSYKGPVHWVHLINILAATGSVSTAIRETGMSRVMFNRRRERYPEFAEEVQAALSYFNEGVLERAALTRAVDGVLEPVFYKGAEVGQVRKFSDTLLTKLLEGNMPEKYRSKADNSAPAAITITGGLPDDEDEEPAAPAPDDKTKPPAPEDDPLA